MRSKLLLSFTFVICVFSLLSPKASAQAQSNPDASVTPTARWIEQGGGGGGGISPGAAAAGAGAAAAAAGAAGAAAAEGMTKADKSSPKGGHSKNVREGNREKHENADARRQKEQKKAEEKKAKAKKKK